MTYHLSGPDEDAMLGDLEVRTAGAPEALVATLRQVLAEAEPTLPVYDILPIEQRIARSLSQDAVVARLTSIFSAIALLLACLGLYGTISYGVTQRIGELGLRIALGADRGRVLWLVMREALVLVAVGSAAGFTLAYLAGPQPCERALRCWSGRSARIRRRRCTPVDGRPHRCLPARTARVTNRTHARDRRMTCIVRF